MTRGRAAGTLLTLALLGAWWVTLRPAFLGGPAGFVAIAGTSMEPGLETGDLAVLRRRESYERGDVIAYRIPESRSAKVIHRVVGGSAATGYRTRGDNRGAADPWRPRPLDIEGAMWLDVPHGAALVGQLRRPVVLAGLAALLAFLAVGNGGSPRPRRGPGSQGASPTSA